MVQYIVHESVVHILTQISLCTNLRVLYVPILSAVGNISAIGKIVYSRSLYPNRDNLSGKNSIVSAVRAWQEQHSCMVCVCRSQLVTVLPLY